MSIESGQCYGTSILWIASFIVILYLQDEHWQVNKEGMENCNAWKSTGIHSLAFVLTPEVIKMELVFVISFFHCWFNIPFTLIQHHHRQYYFLNSQNDSNFCSSRIYTLAFIFDYYNITFYWTKVIYIKNSLYFSFFGY